LITDSAHFSSMQFNVCLIFSYWERFGNLQTFSFCQCYRMLFCRKFQYV